MMNTCEETTSICSKFQSAICFHCNRRLCLGHITEHNRIMSHVNNLSNEIKITYQQIQEESEKRRDIFNNILTSFNKWRAEQIEQIDRIYQNHLQIIESQREGLTHAEMKLFEQLEYHARQPLEHLQTEVYIDMNLINHIQQMNKQIREDNKYLKWKLTTTMPPPVSSSTLPAMPSAMKNEETFFLNFDIEDHDNKTSSNKIIHPQRGRGLKRLVRLFANISSIKRAKKDIVYYLEKQGGQFQLPIVICSYLTAWHKKSKINEKVFLLNEHITTIQKYLDKRKSDADVLIGIQAFFYNETIEENKSEMMTFLLQFFLNHQCVDRNQILNWYDKDIHGYKGFNLAKQLATPFIRSFSTSRTVEVKQEPVEII